MTIEKHERSTKDLVKAAVSGWLGTALEFMDFQLYSLGAALVFHEIFFPESSTAGNDSNLLIVFYVQIMPDDLVMQLHR
ncbi:hypothetical protein QP334_06295, partial [Escherichia coli]|nr:hypothetical protein [Escherichia coli]